MAKRGSRGKEPQNAKHAALGPLPKLTALSSGAGASGSGEITSQVATSGLPGTEGSREEAPMVVLEASELKAYFEAEHREVFFSNSYERVAMLLISWEEEQDDQRDTDDDVGNPKPTYIVVVKKLRDVIQDEYHFEYHEARLYSARDRSPPRHQLRAHVAGFIKAEDGPSTLLLIHYAGHGVRRVPKEDLWPAAGKKDEYQEKKLVQLVWENIAGLLEDADSDILLLLDACYAGLVMKGKGRFRDHQLQKSFAIIGGTPGSELCRAPGENSFTTTTARALESLSTRHDGFFAEELFEEIRKKSKSVTDDKEPLFLQTGASFPCLRIGASTNRSPTAVMNRTTSREDQSVAAALQVQILFSAYPNKDDMTNIVRQFHRAVETRDTPIRQLCWQNFSTDGVAVTKASSADIAQATLSEVRRRAKTRSEAKSREQGTALRRDGSSRRPLRRRTSADSSDGDMQADTNSSWFSFCSCAAVNSVFGAIALGLGAYYFYMQYVISKKQYDEQMREACHAGGDLVGSRFCEQFSNLSSMLLARRHGTKGYTSF